MTPLLIWQTGHLPIAESASTRHDNSEATLRADFFRQQWEVCGPGQLHRICGWLRSANPGPVTVRLDVPAGAPRATAVDGGNCRCDAMLHDVEPAMPEIQRLTWVITTTLVTQLRNVSADPPRGSLVAETAGFDAGTVAAALTIRSGLEIGILAGQPAALLDLATSLWGLQASRNDVEWAIEFLESGPACPSDAG